MTSVEPPPQQQPPSQPPQTDPPAAIAARTPRSLSILIAGMFALSLLKGLRMPNLWAATHMTFNYSQGFIRRGLFGQALLVFGARRIYNYNFLAAVSVLLLLLAITATARMVRRLFAGAPGDLGLAAAILIFAASPGMVFLAHEIGYLDYVGLAIVPVFIVWAARSRRRWPIFYVATAMTVVMALIHENVLVLFAPTIWLVLAAHVVRQLARERPSRRAAWLLVGHAALAVALAVIACTVVSNVGTRSPELIRALQASVARWANFPLRGDAFDTLRHSMKENLLVILPRHWSYTSSRRYLRNGLLVSLPGLGVMTAYALRLIARLDLQRRARAALGVLFVFATFSPLLLNLVAWDSARWNALCFVAAMNGIATLRLFFTTSAAAARRHRIDDPVMLAAAAGGIVIGLVSDYPNFLFDGYVVQWFPWEMRVQALIDLWRGNFTFIPRL